MEDKFSDEQIRKALEQADANISFEEVELPVLQQEKNNQKVLRMDFNDKRNRRSN